MVRVLRVRKKNASSTDSSDASQGSVKTCRTVLTNNRRNIKAGKAKLLSCADNSSDNNENLCRSVLTDNSRNIESSKAKPVNCADNSSDNSENLCRAVLTDNSRNIEAGKIKPLNCTDSSSDKSENLCRAVLTNNFRNIKSGKAKPLSSTDGSSDNCENFCRTVLTDNSRNIKAGRAKPLSCTDSSSDDSENFVHKSICTGNSRIKLNSKHNVSNQSDTTTENSDTDNAKSKSNLNGLPVTQENVTNGCTTMNDKYDGFDGEKGSKNEEQRSVLLDKTNSILKNKANVKSTKTKNKVYFSSTDRVRKISQRRISDFFHVSDHDSHDASKSPRSCQRKHREKILECICHPDDNVNLKPCGENCVKETVLNNTKHHIPVYKLALVNGNNSFRLTPPQVKDKNALYEFEVDENEPRANPRKRRPFKTYKTKKRIRKIDDNLKTNDELDIPQRTMALRNDGQVNNGIDYNEHNESDVLNVTDVYDPVYLNSNKNRRNVNNQPKRNKVVQLKNNLASSSCTIVNKENIPKVVSTTPAVSNGNHNVINLQTTQGISKDLKSKENKVKLNCNSAVVSKNSVNQPPRITNDKTSNDSTIENNCNPESENCVIDIVGNKDNVNKIAVSSSESICMNTTSTSQQPNISACSSSRSPFPEYSRIGPIYATSSINCSETEYCNNFIRGITASTPFKAMKSPARTFISDFPVRLSGGETMNRFADKISNLSVDEGEEYFGFDEVRTHNDSFSNAHSSRQKTTENPAVNNEPVQKISINEVINLLKQDVYGMKKSSKVKKVVTFQKIFDYSKDSPSSCTEESSSSSESYSSPSQSTIQQFMNNSNTEIKNKPETEMLNTSFTKPPRRSYTHITPRIMKRTNYAEDEEIDEEVAKVVAPKKPYKRVNKLSKKEQQEMERLTQMMNSQFKEVDKFSLVVE